MKLLVGTVCAAVLLFSCFVTACGNKGPLYLPDDAAGSRDRTEGR